MRNVVVLGSTGSIGQQTLDICAQFPDEIRVLGLAAGRNEAMLRRQMEQFNPRWAALIEKSADWEWESGTDALLTMASAPEVDLVVVAIVGAGGLLPTLAALEAGKRVALANKEALVMAGPVIKRQLARAGELVPIDSEHSAIWQCLHQEQTASVERLVLTASGGAFRDWAPDDLDGVQPAQALEHPTWRMGPKITVDSATLMNKGLEVIEATLLFAVGIEQVDVLMHRESIVHSLVYFTDSSVKAQLGLPDMRLPIQYALSYPHRLSNQLPRLDLAAIQQLHFASVDWDRYPCLAMAVEAGRRGGTFPTALCAADEMAVDLFLHGRLRFTDIPRLIERVLTRHENCDNPGLDDILEADSTARRECRSLALSLEH